MEDLYHCKLICDVLASVRKETHLDAEVLMTALRLANVDINKFVKMITDACYEWDT